MPQPKAAKYQSIEASSRNDLKCQFNNAWIVGCQDSKPCPAHGAHFVPTRYSHGMPRSTMQSLPLDAKFFAPSKLQEHVCLHQSFVVESSVSTPLGSTLTTLNSMQRCGPASGMVLGFFLVCSTVLASGQMPAPSSTVTFTVVDEDGLPVSDAQVMLSGQGRPPIQLRTDYAGRCAY